MKVHLALTSVNGVDKSINKNPGNGGLKMKTYIVEWSESWRGKIHAETEGEARDLFHEGEVVDMESISTDLDTIVEED